MRKNFSSLKIGDVIWANPPKIGRHIFIICDLNANSSFDCFPAVNLSSNCSKCKNCCIDINGIDIPKDWFSIKKEVSYLRIDNPFCLKIENYKDTHYSFKGNLKENYSVLFDKICSYNSTITRQVCGCEVH